MKIIDIKKYGLFIGVLLITSITFKVLAQNENAGSVVWQYSVDIYNATGGSGQGIPRAYMWIPPKCTKVRGMVLGQSNMQESSVLENPAFRDSMASIGFGCLYITPRLGNYFNVQEGDNIVFLKIMSDLANLSGYKELNYIPFVPIGHSALANFPFEFMAGMPERALCGVSLDGMLPYDFNNLVGANYQCGSTIDYMPFLAVISDQESVGRYTSTNTIVFNRRAKYPKTPISLLPAAGEWHFATTQKRSSFIGYYIKKVAAIRLTTDATSSSVATLKPIDPTKSGWLVDRWRNNMRPRYPRAPVASYTGTMAKIGSVGEENFWCVDSEMAAKVEDYQNTFFRKACILTAYNQSSVAGVVGPQIQQQEIHLQNTLSFYPLNDSLDFELSASFLDTIPKTSSRMVSWMYTTDTTTGNWTYMKVGAKVNHPAATKSISIMREGGPLSKIKTDSATGITTFRMTKDRGMDLVEGSGNDSYTFSMCFPGDSTYKQFYLQAQMYIWLRNNNGLAQTISFPQLPNLLLTDSVVSLNATSSIGMPVQYFVKEGPAILSGSKLIIKDIPAKSKFPIRVTVVAYQWGRDAGLAARTAGKSVPFPGQAVQTAISVEDTFYINQLPMDSITGNVVTPNGKSISGALIKVKGTTIDSSLSVNGNYGFEEFKGGSYMLRTSKNNDVVKTNGVTALDLTLTQAHILGKIIFNSPYKIIAADVNGDKKVTALDLVYMKRFILALDTVYPVGRLWTFVDSSFHFADSANPYPFKDSIVLNPLSANVINKTFIGLKLGDVNWDWNPAIAKPANKVAIKPEDELKLEQELNKEYLE